MRCYSRTRCDELRHTKLDCANLSCFQDVLRAYIREMDQEGLLDNPPSDEFIPPHPAGQQAKRQLEASAVAPPASKAPPFPLQQVQKDDTGTKEMLAREDNMKFPQSMKFEHRKPESRADAPLRVEMTQISKPPDAKDPYFINTDGTSEEDDDSDSSMERPKSPTHGDVIKTTELLALSQAIMLRPPAGAVAPVGFNAGSFVDDHGRPIPIRSRGNEYPASPSQPGAMPIPLPNPQHNNYLSTSPLPNSLYNDRLGTSPRPDASYLAPDQKGNEIKPDALWTKIDRRLVSPEVLAQDGRRYEA